MGDFNLIWLLHLGVWIYALLQIWNSSADQTSKIIWILVVGFLPLIGLIAWFFMGPGTPKK